MKNRIVFIIAVGRSGTKWLANILSKSDNTIVYHEPLVTLAGDREAYLDKYFNRKLPVDLANKKKFINRQIKGNDKTYIEVNGYLRLCIPELKKAFPGAKFVHLVRNGKDVVRSMMSKSKSILRELKGKSTAFETACNIWRLENYQIEEFTSNMVRLEDLTSDYKSYKKLLEYIGIKLSVYQWERLKDIKINNTKKHSFRLFKNCTDKQREIFKDYCKQTMVIYGYK